MERIIVTTADGSTSIRLPQWDENYHSQHGAIQEAEHVFIKNGLAQCTERQVSILEIGFGTGLNALVTYRYAQQHGLEIDYTGIEGFPVEEAMALSMNYPELLGDGLQSVFAKMHQVGWNRRESISKNFLLIKKEMMFDQIDDTAKYDLIYFDAFGFRVQPELWSEEIFHKMSKSLKPGGILVTYAARSVIRRNMQAAGFEVMKLEGPPGKREMMRATKI